MMRKLKIVKITNKEIVKNNKRELVHDLTVKNDSSFLANNKIVHNSACTTWPTTGFGSRNCQASTVYNCSLKSTIPIIADGGIRQPGDITKSIVLGADMVMIGGMLSGFKDSPGHLINIDGVNKKEFWGSASEFQSGKTNRIEGKKILIDYKDQSLLDYLKYLEECLQSSISYGGGDKLEDLYNVDILMKKSN